MTIYGHSLGGIVALLVAAQSPEHVRAVIVGDSPLTADAWISHLQRDRLMLECWRALAGGHRPISEVIAGLKEIPIHWPCCGYRRHPHASQRAMPNQATLR